MTAIVLVAVTGLLLVYGGSDRLAEWLMPSIPLPLGKALVLGSLILVTTLIVPFTRMLAQQLIIGFVRTLLRLLVTIVVSTAAVLRTFCGTFAQTARTQARVAVASLRTRLAKRPGRPV